MDETDANGLEHRIDQTRGVVWLGLSAILIVQVHRMESTADPALWVGVLLMATLAYAAFVSVELKTNRYALPVLRAFGKEEWSYYYTPPEEVAN
jgi:hypothetical protein